MPGFIWLILAHNIVAKKIPSPGLTMLLFSQFWKFKNRLFRLRFPLNTEISKSIAKDKQNNYSEGILS